MKLVKEITRSVEEEFDRHRLEIAIMIKKYAREQAKARSEGNRMQEWYNTGAMDASLTIYTQLFGGAGTWSDQHGVG